jgi:hypothetical protein
MAGNAARAPITAALIEKVPGLVTANFSVMEAGGHIPRHWGMTKGMLTYHLALRAPRDTEKARMHLEEGETFTSSTGKTVVPVRRHVQPRSLERARTTGTSCSSRSSARAASWAT